MQPVPIHLPQWVTQYQYSAINDLVLAKALLGRGGSVQAVRRSNGVNQYDILCPISAHEMLSVVQTMADPPQMFEDTTQYDATAISVALTSQGKTYPYCVGRIQCETDTALALLSDMPFNHVTEQYDFPLPSGTRVVTGTMRLQMQPEGTKVDHVATIDGSVTIPPCLIQAPFMDVLGRPFPLEINEQAALDMFESQPLLADIAWWDAAIAWCLLDMTAPMQGKHSWKTVEWLWVGSTVAEAQIRLLIDEQ